MSKFFVTTPIYYINDQPHIGHAYSTIAADCLARFHRSQGDDVLFTTGIDENSQKTILAAKNSGLDTRAYTESMAKVWQQTWNALTIRYDRFIRTTEAAHHVAVQQFIAQVAQAGDIFKGVYEGLYCVGHEAFLRPEELVEGKCPDHNQAPQPLKEENYFFRLSRYQEPLLEYIRDNPDFIQPESRRNEVVSFIRQGLADVSISRVKQDWGIPWPGDDSQSVYVWFDALINYLTCAGYPSEASAQWWPADLHIVGKDIIKFHCIIWPAMLMSAKLPLPKMVYAHGFFTVEGKKISKSLGNAISPVELAGLYGVDALRYYLLREIPFGADGEFNTLRFERIYNADLANELGNLVQRTGAMIIKYMGGITGETPPHSHDPGPYYEAMAKLRFDLALENVWSRIKGLNQMIDEEKPWVMAKTDPEGVANLLKHIVADLLQVAELLAPFMPDTAAKIVTSFESGSFHPEVGLLFPKAQTNV